MALADYKITDSDVTGNGVQSVAGTKLTGTAAENKVTFDKLVAAVVRTKLNGLIDALAAALAGKMAAPDSEGVAGQYLRTDGAGGRSWDTPSGSGDMLRSEYDADGDGVVDSAETCAGNAATADRLKTARTVAIQDADGTNSGVSVSFDGSGNIVLKLPAALKAALTGNVTGNVLGNVNGNAATASDLAAGAVLSQAKGGTGGPSPGLTFTEVSVAASAFTADAAYADFPYAAAVACAGVTAAMFAEVVLSPADALGGNYAPVCLTGAGTVTIYAAAVPGAALTIPTIHAWR